MGFDSHAEFQGVKKTDAKKLRNPEGYQWTDYYDLDAWVYEEHETLARTGRKRVLTQAVLKRLKELIEDGGFGDNPEVDKEYREQTLEFVSDALLAIRLGGKVLYWSEDTEESTEFRRYGYCRCYAYRNDSQGGTRDQSGWETAYSCRHHGRVSEEEGTLFFSSGC